MNESPGWPLPLYKRTFGEYPVSNGFVKHPKSSKDQLYYHLIGGVVHPETQRLYDNANREVTDQRTEQEVAPAGAWLGDFPGQSLPGLPWVSLQAEDGVSSHTDELLTNLDRYLFPEIERQLQLPLSVPTPPSERPLGKSKEQRDQELLSGLLKVLPSIDSLGDPMKSDS